MNANNIKNLIDMDNNNDLYNILNLDHNASQEDIKKSYKKLALKYHPDKNNNNELSKKNFLKIKNAYDILSNIELKKKYDNRILLSKSNNDILNIYINLNNFIYSENFEKIIKIMIKKGLNFNLYNNNLVDFHNSLKKILDINIIVDFTIQELWFNICKKIKYERETCEIFEELIFPFDLEQIYEKEGENFKINDFKYYGDLIIKINIINNIHNGENYFIYENELYNIINKNRIKNDYIIINFLDENIYKFNIKKLKLINNKLGKVYMKKKFGLLNNFNNINNLTDVNTRGNLYFIFVI